MASALSHAGDQHIASDSCKLKEATNQITRADAPHSAIAKLRRDMQFNILTPVQSHIANNRNLKVSLEIRRRRLLELTSAKKGYEECGRKNYAHTDKRFLQAQANLESAKLAFNEVDRHVFEWLYILEEYRGDILDSTLQTLKYLEYEFFATSAHAISTSLPARMEFRPMVEMTPEHLEAQVEMELQESEEAGSSLAAATGVELPVVDFSIRLIEKKAKEGGNDDSSPAVPVDPLSLSSLLSQGFQEGPARRALRLHHNDTQAALDWLINGQHEEVEKRKQVEEGVRMPTTVKRVQKLKAMRKAQLEKKERKDKQGESSKGATASSSTSGGAAASTSPAEETPLAAPAATVEDLLDMTATPAAPSGQPSSSSAPAPMDLLNLDAGGGEALPTDFSKPVDLVSLPLQFSFDPARCEKPPIPAAVAAGVAQPRAGDGLAGLMDGLLPSAPAPAATTPTLPTQTAPSSTVSLDPFHGLG